MDNDSQPRFLPLDLPKFEHKQKVLDVFATNTKFKFSSKKIHDPNTPLVYPTLYSEGFWQKEELTVRDRNKPFNDPTTFTEDALLKYPDLIEYMTTHWPFEHYIFATLMRANRPVHPHVDGNFVDDKGLYNRYNTVSQEYYDHQIATEPCGYRMIIKGNRSSLYLCDTYDPTYEQIDWTGLEKQYCVIPEDTDCFVLKTNDSPHGVDYIEDDNDRLLLFAIGWLDVDKHRELIEKSKIRYA
jgi:hypothetical protein